MKIQAVISMSILFGFITVGREFYTAWMGKSYTVMWLPIIIIFVPLSIANLASVPDIILDAKLKKLSRSVALLIMAIINLIISLLLVDRYGFYGVAIGTSASFLFGNILIMGIVYIRNIRINIFRLYLQVSWKSIVCGGISCIISLLFLHFFLSTNILRLLIGGCCFLSCYLILFYLAMNKKEKKQLQSFKNKVLSRL